MENVNDNAAKPPPSDATTGTDAADGWNPYDEYDCRPNEPKQTQAYIDETMPWLKDALTKRLAKLETDPKKP